MAAASGVKLPETIAIAPSARELGACAACAFGAGFGGSVWALALRSNADHFRRAWQAQYATEFPGPVRRSEFFLTAAGPSLAAI